MSMERAKFKERMKALKAYRDETGKGYWDWKVQAFDGGGGVNDRDDDKLYIGRTDQDYYGNLTHNIVVDENGDEVNFGLPDIVITPKNNLSLASRNYSDSTRDVIKEAASFVPYVGDAMDVYEVADAVNKGNYTTAALLGAGLLLPNVLEKSGKLLYKGLRKLNVSAPLARDLVLHPKELYKAYKQNRVPLTFSQKRKYLEAVHAKDDELRAIQQAANAADFEWRSLIFADEPYVADKTYWRYTDKDGYPFNTKTTFNSKTFKNFSNATNLGVNDSKSAINSHVNLLPTGRSRKTAILQSPLEVAATAVHERQHSLTRVQPEFHYMSIVSPEEGYWVPRGGHLTIPKEVSDIFEPLNKNVGLDTWKSSPSEWFSNAMEYRVAKQNGLPYGGMTKEAQEEFVDFMYMHHGKAGSINPEEDLTRDEIKEILEKSSALGFSKGGVV